MAYKTLYGCWVETEAQRDASNTQYVKEKFEREEKRQNNPSLGDIIIEQIQYARQQAKLEKIAEEEAQQLAEELEQERIKKEIELDLIEKQLHITKEELRKWNSLYTIMNDEEALNEITDCKSQITRLEAKLKRSIFSKKSIQEQINNLKQDYEHLIEIYYNRIEKNSKELEEFRKSNYNKQAEDLIEKLLDIKLPEIYDIKNNGTLEDYILFIQRKLKEIQ